MAAPEPDLEGMDLLIKMLDLSGRALWQEFTGNAKASEAGQKAGADVGQGVQTGIAGQVPGVVGQMLQLLNAMQAAVGSGVKVPVTVYGPIDIPNPMAAEGSNTGPAIFKPSSSAAPTPLARRETAMVQHNTFNMNGGDPKANARETGRILDAQLQRSRGLSMDGRPEYG